MAHLNTLCLVKKTLNINLNCYHNISNLVTGFGKTQQALPNKIPKKTMDMKKNLNSSQHLPKNVTTHLNLNSGTMNYNTQHYGDEFGKIRFKTLDLTLTSVLMFEFLFLVTRSGKTRQRLPDKVPKKTRETELALNSSRSSQNLPKDVSSEHLHSVPMDDKNQHSPSSKPILRITELYRFLNLHFFFSYTFR